MPDEPGQPEIGELARAIGRCLAGSDYYRHILSVARRSSSSDGQPSSDLGDNKFGFKHLSPSTWLTADTAWHHIVMSASSCDPATAWVTDTVAPRFHDGVPLELHKLLEVARGAIIYAIFFYPLLTLGAEQLFRIGESAVAARCAQLNAPAGVKRFAQMIAWLEATGVIPAGRRLQWQALKQLRNAASHPKEQDICAPGDAMHILELTVEFLNSLFPI
jgi:hypothetical protein